MSYHPSVLKREGQRRTLLDHLERGYFGSPHCKNEIINYEHEVDSNGEVIADNPDCNDHWIDSLRYATSPLSMRRGHSA